MRLLILLTFIFISPFAKAQYNISGFIYDESGILLKKSAVILITDSRTYSVESDQYGQYSFKNLPNGNYQVFFKRQSYEKLFPITIKDKNQKLDIYASTTDESILDDLVIKVESVKSTLEKEGFAVNIIETKDAALRNIQTNELLDRTAGVRVRQNGGLGSAVDYNLNGMTGNSVRIFIDGIPISTYGTSFNLNSIPPALIERIEVYKGVIPVHLSDDALGGAINVVLKKGVRNSLNASISYGSFNTIQSNFSGMYRNKNGLTLKASGFYNYSDNDYEIWGKFARNLKGDGTYEFVRAKRFDDTFKSIGGRIEAGFTDVKWADTFLVGFNTTDSYKEIQHGLYMTIPYKGRFTDSKANVVSLNYAKQNIFTQGLNFDFNGMISQRQQIINDTVKWRYNWHNEIVKGLNGEDLKTLTGAQQGAPTLNHINRKIATLRAGASYEFLANHKLVVNHVLYNVNREDEDQLKPIAQRVYASTSDLEKNITSIGYEMKVNDMRLKTNLFAKFYNQKTNRIDPRSVIVDGLPVKEDVMQEATNSATGYGIAASYLFSSSIVGLISAEKAVRMPSEGEVFGDPGENIISNSTIKPEVSNNINIGVKLGSYKISHHKISFSGSGFIRDTRDKIMRQASENLNDALQSAPFINYGKTKAIGFEAEIAYSFQEKLNVLLNVSRFKSLYNIKHDRNGNVFSHYNEQLPNEPFFTANGSIQYALNNIIAKKSQLFLNYNFGFVESFYTIQPPNKGLSNRQMLLDDATTPRQFVQDFGLSYVFPNKQLVASFDVKNIFNEQAFDNFAVQKPGRSFYLKLNYSFNKF